MNRFYDASLNEELFCEPIDFVVDAIDTLSSKRDCIEYCLLHQIQFISSMGMANRLDPTKLTIMELMKTTLIRSGEGDAFHDAQISRQR